MSESSTKNSIFKDFFRMPRFAPAIFSAFLCGLLLLFLRDLDQNIKTYLLPSLFIYAQGAAILGFLHRHLGLHYEKKPDVLVVNNMPVWSSNNERTIPTSWKITVYSLHIAWFILFIVYNYKKSAI